MQDDIWVCLSCGYGGNRLSYCANCGSARVLQYVPFRCDKCGWAPDDPSDPPSFCPKCGDKFDAADAQLMPTRK